MINELVSSILEAEQRASEITAEASVRAQSISDEARVKAGEQLKAADVKLREDLSIETEKTKALAEEIYNEILLEGKKEAQNLKYESAKSVEKFAEEIARGVLSGNC